MNFKRKMGTLPNKREVSFIVYMIRNCVSTVVEVKENGQ